MSIEAMNHVYSLTVGSPTKKSVMLVLANMADHDGKCWPSINYISKRTELSKRSVTRAIGQLVDSGYLETHQRFNDQGQKSNLYLIPLEGVTVCHGVTESVAGGDTVSPRTIINNHIIEIGAKEEFSDYLKMRRLKKAPWSDRAATRALNKLNALSEDPKTQRKIIEQSADKGWTDFYLPKEQLNGHKSIGPSASTNQGTPADRNKAAGDKLWGEGNW